MNPETQGLLDDILPRLEKLKADALAEIEEAQKAAQKNVGRHAQAAEELAYVEASIARFEQEREELPNRAYRAQLDEAWEEEDRLKERYKNLKPALETLEERRGSLREELHRLNPDGEGHPNNVTVEQYVQAARPAYDHRVELEDLKKKLTEALDAAVDPVVQKHDSLRATVEALSRDIAWANSPVGRGAIR